MASTTLNQCKSGVEWFSLSPPPHSSVLRPFRHTGTLLGLQLMTSIIKVVNIITKELQVTLRQIKSAKAKASAKPTKTEAAKVRDLTEKAHDLKEKIDVLDERMDQIFKGCVPWPDCTEGNNSRCR